MWVQGVLLAVALLAALWESAPVAAQTSTARLTVSDCETAWEGGTLDAEHVKQGDHSVRWAHGESREVTASDIAHDWSGFNALSLWLYSEKATGVRFHLLAFSENAESEGIDYYSLALKVDFAGWRRLLVPFDEIGRVRSPLGLHHIERLTLHAAWDPSMVIDPETVLYIDAVELVQFAQQGGPRMTDEELFDALDLDAEGMAPVKAALEEGDLGAAKHALAEHIRTRRGPEWFNMQDARPEPPAERPDTARADKVMAHELTIHSATKQFGPRIEWDANPLNEGEERTNEWNASLNRHYHMPPLVSAYLATGEDKYAAEVVAQITAWIEDCPVLIHSSGNSPYHYAWETLNVAVRLGRTWPDVFFQCLPSPAVTDEFIVLFLKSSCEHARHLMKWPSNGNWLTMESTGVFYTGVLYPMFKEAAAWRRTAIERLYMQLNEQVYPDGLEYELAMGYNLFCLRNFTGVLDLAKLNGLMDEIPDDYLATIENMYEYIMYATMPDGRVPGLNDSGDANAEPLLRKALEYFPQRTDFLYVATGGAEGEPPAQTSHSCPYAGHYIMRSGWGEAAAYMLFDAGLFGAGHQHEDKLTFVLSSGGRPQIVDAGNYYYNASRWRRYVLSTRGHNTIMVDGLDQSRRGNRETYIQKPPFEPLNNQWVSDESFDYVVATYDDGYGPDSEKIAAHTRSILFVKPDYWIVVDALRPADEESHTYESLFHLNAEEAAVDDETKAVTTGTTDDSGIAIVPVAAEGLDVDVVKGLEEEPVQGWANHPWRPVPTAIYKIRARGPVDLVQVLCPVAAGEDRRIAEVTAIPVEATVPTTGAAIRFSDGATHYFVQRGAPGGTGSSLPVARAGTIRFADFETDAQMALVRVSAAGEAEDMLQVGGTFVRRRVAEQADTTREATANVASSESSVFAKDNLVAWCIVPFDAAGRGPEERAEMLEGLGITRLAYDWRDKDIPTFDDEIDALQKHGIKLEAFWLPCRSLDPAGEEQMRIILDLLRRRQVKTQLWVSLNNKLLDGLDQTQKVEAAAGASGYIAGEAQKIGCSVALYNHGGWFGEPENQIAIIEHLNVPNLGIVYNLHHGHEHLDRFPELFAKMQPHLLTLSINGMKAEGPMIIPLGEGDRELEMLRLVRESGYRGPIGILDHRPELDAELSLKENLEGLQKLLKELGDEAALHTY